VSTRLRSLSQAIIVRGAPGSSHQTSFTIANRSSLPIAGRLTFSPSGPGTPDSPLLGGGEQGFEIPPSGEHHVVFQLHIPADLALDDGYRGWLLFNAAHQYEIELVVIATTQDAATVQVGAPVMQLSDPEEQAEAHAKSGKGTGFFETLQKSLGLFGSGVALIAAMGIPAVAVLMDQFGVPGLLATTDQQIRAGLLPTAVLLPLSAYIFFAVRSYTSSSAGGPAAAPIFMMMNLLGAAGFMLVAFGQFILVRCFLLLGIAWAIALLLNQVEGIAISNHALMVMASVAAVVLSLIKVLPVSPISKLEGFGRNVDGRIGLGARVAGRIAKLLRALDRLLDRAALIYDREDVSGRRDEEKEQASAEMKFGWLYSTFVVTIGTTLGAVLVLLLYEVKLLLHIWDSDADTLISHATIWGGLAIVLVLALLFSVLIHGWILTVIGDKAWRPIGFLMIVGVVVVVFLCLATAYSTALYPRLPRQLGGGTPAPVTLWVDWKEVPPQLQSQLGRSRFTVSAGTTQIEDVFLLVQAPGYLIVTDGARPPAGSAYLPTGSIKGIVWHDHP
jgi:hypothetical protein